MSQERSALDATAISVLVMQAAIRSVVATGLVLLWSFFKNYSLFGRDGTLVAGIAAGLLFAFEFVFIYAGLTRPRRGAHRGRDRAGESPPLAAFRGRCVPAG